MVDDPGGNLVGELAAVQESNIVSLELATWALTRWAVPAPVDEIVIDVGDIWAGDIEIEGTDEDQAASDDTAAIALTEATT